MEKTANRNSVVKDKVKKKLVSLIEVTETEWKLIITIIIGIN